MGFCFKKQTAIELLLFSFVPYSNYSGKFQVSEQNLSSALDTTTLLHFQELSPYLQ
jgi:hypothetical protein